MTLYRRFQNSSIRGKLALATVTVCLLGLFVSGLAFVWYGVLSARADLKAEISTITDVVAAHSTAALAFSDS